MITTWRKGFNWQKDVVIDVTTDTMTNAGGEITAEFLVFIVKSDDMGSRWMDAEDIDDGLEGLSDEELKVCLLHQPLIAERIAKRLLK